MSRWKEQFISNFKEVGTLKQLTREIKDAESKKRSQKNIDWIITEVLKGKHKRKGK